MKTKPIHLQKIYANYNEFLNYNEIYCIALRLGYRSAKKAWQDNPLVQCSTNPNEFRKVK